ncbi:hypothetical protein R1flu_011799 [Riccia fluitans]|uniref:Myeloid leukemia factor n=1 Tax=Riccia fluitans TaxID=41844 RepID=A0ABD1ZC37_9MARC
MQHPGRGGRGGQNLHGGGGLFPGFGDPFAALGGFERPGFLSDMFANDPFLNDPFFTRPFGSLFGNSGGLFGPSNFLGQTPFPQPGFPINGRQIFIDERPSNPPPPETHRRGVHIEEVPEDHDVGEDTGLTSNREPIVEHPEDEAAESAGAELTLYQPEVPTHRSRTSNALPGQLSANAPFTYSYQSSSVTYGGANGPYYAAHSSRRRGSDGVYEEQHAEKDMTSGREHHHVVHGLGNKGRALTRKRNAEGREEKFETLHNLADDEVHNFERTWETHAEQAFPRHRSLSQRLGSGSGTRSRAALLSHDGMVAGSASTQDPGPVSDQDARPGSRQGARPGSRQASTQSPKKGLKPGLTAGSKAGLNLGSSTGENAAPKKYPAKVGQPGPSAASRSRRDPAANGRVAPPNGELKSSKREVRRVGTE